MAISLSEMFPSLRLVVQIYNTQTSVLDQDFMWQSAVLGSSVRDSSSSGRSSFSTNPFITVTYRAMEMPQSVTDAAVYISPVPGTSSELTIKAELDDFLVVLRASRGITLALTTRLLPEPGTLFNPEVEAVARARDLSMLQLANESEIEMSELLSIINTVGDSLKACCHYHLR